MYKLFKIEVKAEQIGGWSYDYDESKNILDTYCVCAYKEEYAKERAKSQFRHDHPIHDCYVLGTKTIEIQDNILL